MTNEAKIIPTYRFERERVIFIQGVGAARLFKQGQGSGRTTVVNLPRISGPTNRSV